jgi:hypothetical protein
MMYALVGRICYLNIGVLKCRVVWRSGAGVALRCVRFYLPDLSCIGSFYYDRWMRVLDVKYSVALMQRERVLGAAVSASAAAVKAIAAVEETKVLEEKAAAAAAAARMAHAVAVEFAAAARTIAEEKAAEFKCAVWRGFEHADDDDVEEDDDDDELASPEKSMDGRHDKP